MRTLSALLTFAAAFLVFPIVACGLLIVLAKALQPDRLSPDLGGWVWLAIVIVSMIAAYAAAKATNRAAGALSDPRRR